jgi:hypothetical protein
MQRLLAVADEFDVPATYVVFFGEASSRPDLRCAAHAGDGCARCERSSVAILSGLAARWVLDLDEPYHPDEIAPDSYRQSIPLEDFGRPADRKVPDVNWGALSPELREFLWLPQSGARAVAKHIFEVASTIRLGQHGAISMEVAPAVSEYVFPELPADVGHSGPPYWVHTLRGLRKAPPEYVTAFLNDPTGTGPPPNVAGIAVIHL